MKTRALVILMNNQPMKLMLMMKMLNRTMIMALVVLETGMNNQKNKIMLKMTMMIMDLVIGMSPLLSMNLPLKFRMRKIKGKVLMNLMTNQHKK